jgi:hypothetical protein
MSEEDVRAFAKLYERLVELNKETENLMKDLETKDPNVLTQQIYDKLGEYTEGIRMFVDYLVTKECKHLAEDFVGFLAMNFLMLEKVKNNPKLSETVNKVGEKNLKLFFILSSLDAAFRKQILSLM